MTQTVIQHLIATCTLIGAIAAPSHAEVIAEKLGPMPDSAISVREIAISADCRHVAMAAGDHMTTTLFVDGVKKTPHADIKAISISADGQHVADWAAEGVNWIIEVDGKAVGNYPNNIDGSDLTPTPVIFSADGKHWAYSARSAAGWVLSQDGKESNPGGEVKMLRLSADGTHSAYVVDLGDDKRAVVMDGKRGEPQRASEQWVLTDDAQHWACVADVKAAEIDSFNVERGHVVRDNVAGETIVVRPWAMPRLVQRGAHIGYSMDANSIAIDGVTKQTSDLPFAVTFTPDMTHMAALVARFNGTGQGSGAPFREYDLWIDGKTTEWKKFGWTVMRPTCLSISADGARAAAVFEGTSVVVDGKVVGNRYTYGSVTMPLFSADGKHVAYSGEFIENEEKTFWELAVDGKPIADYSPLRQQPAGGNYAPAILPYCFSADGSLSFIGVKDGVLYRMTWKP